MSTTIGVDDLPGANSDTFTFDPVTEQLIFEESETEIICYAYPLGEFVPYEVDPAFQDARVVLATIDKSLHVVTLIASDEVSVDPV